MKQKIALGVMGAVAFYVANLMAHRFVSGYEANVVPFEILGVSMTVILLSHQTDPGRRRKILIGGVLISSGPLIIIASSLLLGDAVEVVLVSMVLACIAIILGCSVALPAVMPERRSTHEEYEEPSDFHGRRRRSKRR